MIRRLPILPRPPSRPIIIEDLLLNTAGLSHRFGALYREQEVRSRAELCRSSCIQ